MKGPGGGKCPQCNAKAKKADIRVIFAKTIAVVDTTERDRALKVRQGSMPVYVHVPFFHYTL